MQNFLHCFLQHRVKVKGPVKKSRIELGKEAQVGHHCSYALVKCVLGKGVEARQTLICAFQNPCRFCFKSFVFLALIGLKMLSSFVRQCLCD